MAGGPRRHRETPTARIAALTASLGVVDGTIATYDARLRDAADAPAAR